MSETISYSGTATGFKEVKEKDEFKGLAEDFQNADVTESDGNGVVDVEVADGWRGGGRTCGEIVAEHFEKWLDEHPNVVFEMNATYVEQAPTETIYQKGKGR